MSARERMARACADPGAVVGWRYPTEPMEQWQARAALAVARELVKEAVPHSQGDGLTAVDTLAWNMARAAALWALGGEP